VHLPAPSTEMPVPQDVKLSTLAPEPSEPLEIMKPPSETFIPQQVLPIFVDNIRQAFHLIDSRAAL
jgi:hypothetical protein